MGPTIRAQFIENIMTTNEQLLRRNNKAHTIEDKLVLIRSTLVSIMVIVEYISTPLHNVIY